MRTVDAAGLRIGDEYPTRIMGVLNVSKESPYDPSVYDDPGEAAAYVDDELIGEGADIVDVGLESANKRLDVLSAEQELERLDTAVETIESVSGDAIFSIETRYASVAAAALDRGFDMVNDICGFADPEMPEICREYDVAVGKMASPPDIERPGAVGDVDWADARSPEWAQQADYVDKVYAALDQNGMTEKTILDPAFGGWSEAKTIDNDHETFRRLPEFRAYGRPLLVSINRKNFLRTLADRSTEEALPVSLAATSMAVERGAHVVRTHDVAETKDAARIGDAFTERASTTASGATATELNAPTTGELRRRIDGIGADGDADSLAGRVLQVDGLSEAARRELAEAAEQVGVTVVAGPDGLLLGGSGAALSALADGLSTPELDGVVDVCRTGR
ncbi:Dihydropteroate synthase [Halovenus aranensis]|uniref:dihydropteroate synthase n=1 Tax=Halovenus aranensis TaxID=890420 RepID=A0A1G8WHH0_9EURY|nr:dihydropteroate synthase [Halovenus aranensis]SDJ77616.1 Dihydropteroate synthase [Halovenus aranensis]